MTEWETIYDVKPTEWVEATTTVRDFAPFRECTKICILDTAPPRLFTLCGFDPPNDKRGPSTWIARPRSEPPQHKRMRLQREREAVAEAQAAAKALAKLQTRLEFTTQKTPIPKKRKSPEAIIAKTYQTQWSSQCPRASSQPVFISTPVKREASSTFTEDQFLDILPATQPVPLAVSISKSPKQDCSTVFLSQAEHPPRLPDKRKRNESSSESLAFTEAYKANTSRPSPTATLKTDNKSKISPESLCRVKRRCLPTSRVGIGFETDLLPGYDTESDNDINSNSKATQIRLSGQQASFTTASFISAVATQSRSNLDTMSIDKFTPIPKEDDNGYDTEVIPEDQLEEAVDKLRVEFHSPKEVAEREAGVTSTSSTPTSPTMCPTPSTGLPTRVGWFRAA